MTAGDELWAWQVRDEQGRWSMVGVQVGDEHYPLVNRDESAVRSWRDLAVTHARATNQPLRLVRFGTPTIHEFDTSHVR